MATSTSTFENEGEGEAPSTPGGSLSTRHKNSGLGPAVVSSARLKELEPPGIDDPVVVDQGHSGHEDAHDEHEHAHAPAKPPETPAEWALWCTTGIISGLINGMLIFVFCCVYGSLIFILRAETAGQGQNDALQPFITYGVSFQAAAAMISGLVGAIGSGAGAMICGPDINPAIFLAAMAEVISLQLRLTGDDKHEYGCADTSGAVTSIMKSEWDCADSAGLMPTLLMMFVIATLTFGCVFLIVGATGTTKVTEFIPAPVLGGFMGCIGYKIMKASLEVATGGSFYECAKLTTTTEPELQLYNISNQSAWPGCANSSSALDAGLWAGAETATCPDGLNCTEMQCQVKMSDPDEVVSFMQSDCGAARILFSWQHGWLKILPALPIGIPMYVLKRLHIGQPKNWMPIFIIVPNVAAYLFMGSLGKLDGLSPVAELRSCGDRTTDCPNGNYNWFFAALDEHDFTAAYDHWDRGKVRWDAIEQSYPVLLLMIIIVNIDCMLKLAGTEKQLQISIDMNHEMAVSSLGNFFSAICFAPPGYGQTKFAVLNFAIVRDTANRLPSVVCALFNAAMYFTGFPLVNYMPRFFLAGLLIFAGAGFVVENLWDSRLTLALSEYLTIWAIVLCNVVTGLLPAIILGIVLSAVTFSTKASRTNVVRFAVTRKAFQSKVIRSPWVEWKLQNLGDQVHVMKLQGFVFFGTASRLLARVQSMLGLRAQWKRPEGQIVDGKWTPTWLNPPEVEAAHEMRYLILDFEAVSDLDSTGMFAFTKLQRLTKAHGVIVLFTGLTPRLQEMMIERNGIVSRRFYLPTLDAAVEYAEELVLRWAADVRSNWYRVPEVRAAQPSIWVTSMSTACLRDLFPRDSISITRLLSYCTKQSLPPAAVLLREGERRQQLYITVVGSIKAHSTQGTTDAQARHVATVSAHAFINDDGFCLGAPIDATYTAQEECKLLSIDAEAFARMRSRDPDVAMALQQALITSILGSRDRLQLEMRALLFNAQDEVEDEVQDMRASDLFSKEGLKGIGSKAQDNLVALKSLAGDVAGTIGSTAAAGVKNVGQVASPHSPRSPRQSAADGGNGRAEAMDNPLSNYSAESSYV